MTITSNNACAPQTATATYSVIVNPVPTVTVNSSTICAGATASVTATPGTAGPYSYAWTVPVGATVPPVNVDSFTTTIAGTDVELTEAEWAIIKAVWESEPCTAPAIQEKLERVTRWSYSTVRTMMDRMVVKGLLLGQKTGKVTQFRSAVTRDQAQRGELLYALKNAFNGALTPMMQCLLNSGEVSPSELAELEALIKAKKKSGRK
jgi:predicted transcriptional regulator